MVNKIFIGIDCDTDASGVAVWTENQLSIYKMKFFKLFDFFKQFTDNRESYYDWEVKVILEAGWLNKKSNWHSEGKGEFVSGRIGAKVGANHQVGKLIVEMCEYLGLEYELHQPVSSKMGINLFRKMTGYKGKLDQDMIDAGCLVYKRV